MQGLENFEGMLVEETVIAAPGEVVRQALLDVNTWPGVLSYVHDVRLIYDDGLYQEFAMDLDIGNGTVCSVRTVQRCQEDHIAYFQPEPPAFLKHHCGDWYIRRHAENATHLTVVQRWTRSARADSLFSSRDGEAPAQQVTSLLRNHARKALAAWKRSLECLMS